MANTFTLRRLKRVRLIRLMLAVVSGLALVPIVLILPAAFAVMLGTSITVSDVNKFLLGLISTGKLGDLAGRAVNALLLQYPSPTIFAICAFAGWHFFKARAETLHDRAFADFNEDVLARIAAPRPFDPLRGAAGLDTTDVVLKWTIPDAGARRDVWDEAMRFIFTAPNRIPTGRHFETKPATPFGWTILMGRAGSGKSRLAVELARHVARRQYFGTSRPATWQDRFGIWWRIQCLLLAPRPDDPWDAGWLLPGVGPVPSTAYPNWDGRRAIADNPWLDSLRSWRPRRPTLLLLDDPRPGDAKALIMVLEISAKSFSHVVRLLIVNQSAPAELGLTRRSGAWSTAGGLEPLAPPMLLPDESRFEEADIRRLRGSLPAIGGKFPISTDPLVRAFLEITRGNPLLVELGLKWLRTGRPLSAMSEHALLTDRVARILDALRQAGLNTVSHHCAIAVATLAGGAVDSETRQGVGALTAVYPLPSSDSAELARVYPADTADLRNALPPIRPEVIGDAFIRRMIATVSDAEQARMVATAWVVDPNGTLRNALRLGGAPDKLGSLLRTVPTTGTGLDDSAVVLAFAEAAVWLPLGAKPESREAGDVRRLALTATTLCSRLAADAAAAFVSTLLDLGEIREAGRPFLADTWLQLVGTTLSRTTGVLPAQGLAWAERLFAIAARTQGRNVHGSASAALLKGWAALFSTPGWAFKEVWQLADMYQRSRSDIVAQSLSGCLADVLSVITPPSLLRACAYRAATALGSSGDAGQCKELAELVDRIAAPFPNDRDMQLQRAAAWRNVAYASRAGAAECRTLAELVDRIAAPFPNDRDMQLQRAMAWCNVAYASRADAAECRTLAELVDRIAAPFPDDRDIQLQRAMAWRNVAYASTAAAAECRTLAELVDRIAAPFPDDRDMLFEQAVAWSFVAYASTADAAECCTLAELVDRIAALFPDDRDMQLQRAAAWSHVAYASRADAAECRALAELVDRIAAPFPDDRDMQLQRAAAWSHVTGASTAAAECCTLAELVDRIAVPFPDDRDMQLQRTAAWSHVTGASTAAAAECRMLAELVDRIAAPFPDDRDIQLQRVLAWRNVAYSSRADAAECRTLAELVDRIAAPFPDDRDIQLQRAEAWRYMVYASTADAAECRMLAGLVDRIAAPFSDDRDIQRQRAEAWRNVAYASRADAAECRTLAELVDRIAAPFPDDRDIQLQRAMAWRNVAYASRADAAKCRTLAELVDRIAASFPDDRDMQLERHTTWRYLDGIVVPSYGRSL